MYNFWCNEKRQLVALYFMTFRIRIYFNFRWVFFLYVWILWQLNWRVVVRITMTKRQSSSNFAIWAFLFMHHSNVCFEHILRFNIFGCGIDWAIHKTNFVWWCVIKICLCLKSRINQNSTCGLKLGMAKWRCSFDSVRRIIYLEICKCSGIELTIVRNSEHFG